MNNYLSEQCHDNPLKKWKDIVFVTKKPLAYMLENIFIQIIINIQITIKQIYQIFHITT